MKKGLLILATVLVLLPVFLVACGNESGVRETRQYSETGFTNVQVGSAFEVEITAADTFSISVTAPEKWFQYIKVEKEENTLKVEMNWGWAFWHNWGFKRQPRIEIAMPELHELDLSGACSGAASGFKSAKDFGLVISGASSVNVEIEAVDYSFLVSGASHVTGQLKGDDLRLIVSGASTVEFEGTVNDMDLQVSGASHATLDELAVKDATIALSGASRAVTAATGTLDIFLSGASTLEYTDSPVLGSIEVTGASTVKKR